MINGLKVVAFDADDTLWDNEPFFQQVGSEVCRILAPYADAQTVLDSLYKTEMGNMADYGYGAVAFTLSLVENAVTVSKGRVRGEEILGIIRQGQQLLHLDATPLEGVTRTLARLKSSGKYRMVLFTKGELLTQEKKLLRSGLGCFFDKSLVVSNKDEDAFRRLCHDMAVEPHELLMVGNSLKSDVQPALAIGAWATYIPYHTMWKHEVVEGFEHERMSQVDKFDDLLSLLLPTLDEVVEPAPLFATERLVLRPWFVTDAEDLYKYASDPELGPRAGWEPHMSVENSLEIIRDLFLRETMWAITLKTTQELVGCIGYLPKGMTNIPVADNEVEVGYWVARLFWNQGICTEALQALVNHCRYDKQFNALVGCHFVDNPASGRVMEKCGFVGGNTLTECPSLYAATNRKVRTLRLENNPK